MYKIKQLYWRFRGRLEDAKNTLDLYRLRIANRFSSKRLVGANGPVISLTSYGQRIDTVHLTIESIGRGTLLPSRIILWIDELDRISKLPAPLLRQKLRGLEISPCRNFGPHKKYYPYVASENLFSQALITCDDDVIYPKTWASRLFDEHLKYPNFIICYMARKIEISKNNKTRLAPYLTWRMCRSNQPSFAHLAIGAAGILYPPKMLMSLQQAGQTFMSCCPRADDLWLNVIAIRNNHKIKQIDEKAGDFPSIPGSQTQALATSNQHGGGNDEAIIRTYTIEDISKIRHDDLHQSIEAIGAQRARSDRSDSCTPCSAVHEVQSRRARD